PNGEIPPQYTCFGENISPALEWSGVPAEAQSLLLLVHDLDAGAALGASTEAGFSHWVVYNLPPSLAGLPENVPAGGQLENGALQGRNDFARFASEGETFPGGALIKRIGYDGPCPPEGRHRYAFTLYVLDSLLDLPPAATTEQVLAAMSDHVLDQAEIIGEYASP
ncbi:MAG: YbhB/YbcL family Raf kinase inhibitor-like protein, partial [Anaerolineales bacterium]